VDVSQAWDHVQYVDLSDAQDMLTRAAAIVRGELYDTPTEIQIDLSDREWFTLLLQAHRRNITLNELVVEILTVAVSTTTPKLDQ
jgi:hypothetical protein